MKNKTKRARALSSRACNFENEPRNDVVCTLHTCFSSYMHFVEPWKTSQWEKFRMRKPHMAVSSTSCFSLRGSRLHHIGYHVAKIIKIHELSCTSIFFKNNKIQISLSVTEKKSVHNAKAHMAQEFLYLQPWEYITFMNKLMNKLIMYFFMHGIYTCKENIF